MTSRIRALSWCLLATQFVACAGAPATSGGTAAAAASVTPAPAPGGPPAERLEAERDEATATAIETALAGSHRSPDSRSRDTFRHPVETLLFFGLKPGMTVAETWPGAGGWYTEILAPVLAGGRLYAAQMAPEPGNPYVTAVRESFSRKLAARPEVYGNVTVTSLGAGSGDIAPPESCDLVLSFRGLHNWMSLGYEKDALAAMHRALKPGGILGVVDHRGAGGKPQDPRASNGYVDEDYAIALIESAGFELAGKSDINANPDDTRDYEQGVWSLPPELRQGNRDRAKLEAIGESDRFTLKFRKR